MYNDAVYNMKKKGYWQYLWDQKIYIASVIALIVGAFIWYWWAYGQDDYDNMVSTWIAAGIVTAATIGLMGGYYITWKRK
jgi:fucose 4-O-acetylase-like acetyltransferase